MLRGLWACVTRVVLGVCDRGQDCKTCSGVCGPVSHGQFSVCVTGGRTVAEHAQMVCGPVSHVGSSRCVTGGRTVKHDQGSVGMSHL